MSLKWMQNYSHVRWCSNGGNVIPLLLFLRVVHQQTKKSQYCITTALFYCLMSQVHHNEDSEQECCVWKNYKEKT